MLSLCSKEKRYGIDASYHEPLPNCQISASQKRTTFRSISEMTIQIIRSISIHPPPSWYCNISTYHKVRSLSYPFLILITFQIPNPLSQSYHHHHLPHTTVLLGDGSSNGNRTTNYRNGYYTVLPNTFVQRIDLGYSVGGMAGGTTPPGWRIYIDIDIHNEWVYRCFIDL